MARRKRVAAETAKNVVAKAAEEVKETVETVVAAVEEKVEEVKTQVTEEAAEAPVEEVQEEVAVEEAAEEVVPAAEEKKRPGRKPGSKNKEVKEVKKEEATAEVYLQFGSGESSLQAVIEKIKAEYVQQGHRVSSIKSLKVYLKPEDRSAYYVINDKVAGRVDLF